jgi:anthrone oxygenase-like protein
VLVAGLLLGAVVPFTLLVIRPTNERLLDPTLDPGSAEAAALLHRWARLHALRRLARGVAFLLLGLHRPGIV